VKFVRDFEMDGLLVDGAGIVPCWADHGHVPGEDSLYAQAKGFNDHYREVLSVRPAMIGACNLGFSPLLPQATEYLHSIYLTDPHNRKVIAPSLSSLSMLADSRRVQALEIMDRLYVPPERNQNIEYYLAPDSPLRQWKTFEYSLLQGLSYTPNLGAADLDALLEQGPFWLRQPAEAFWSKWHKFADENFALLCTHRTRGEQPGMGRLEIYEKCDGRQTLLFIINPAPIPVPRTVPIQDLTGLSANRFTVEELYPAARVLPGSNGSSWDRSESLKLEAAPNSVVLMRITEFTGSPLISGGPAEIQDHGEYYEVIVHGRTGEATDVYIDRAISSIEVVPPAIKRVEGEVTAQVVPGTTGVLRVEFPGRKSETFVANWRMRPGGVNTGLASKWPLRFDGPEMLLPGKAFRIAAAANKLETLRPANRFLGACLYNFPPIDEEARLRVRLKADRAINALSKTGPPEAAPIDPGGAGAEWWYQAEFYLPFAFSTRENAYRPAPEDHLLALPVLTDGEAVRQIKAWVNGQELVLQRHQYSRLAKDVKERSCIFFDLAEADLKLGDNMLSIWLQWG
jgi:hypothetical protein